MNFKILAATGALTAAALLATGANASLIANGGFETGDFSGWVTNPASFPEFIVTNPVNSGTYAAQIAGYDVAPDTLSQAVATTNGQAYTLSFSYWQDTLIANGIDVTWDGVSVYSRTDELISGYQTITATVFGTGSDSLVFAAYNNPGFTYLDDVSLSAAVPESSTWALMLVGFGGLGVAMRSRRRSIAA